MPAAGALQQRCPHRPRFVVPASRTTKTLRPAELTQILSTGLLGGETRLELGQIPRIIFHFPDPTSCGHLSQVNTHLADFDNDGDVDVLVTNKNDEPTLLRNDGGNRRNWLTIRTQGVQSNRDGIGAKIPVETPAGRRAFEVRGSDSYLSSNDMRVHVGLGERASADLEIRWPSGRRDRHEAVAAGKFYLAVEGHSLKVDTPPPPLKEP